MGRSRTSISCENRGSKNGYSKDLEMSMDIGFFGGGVEMSSFMKDLGWSHMMDAATIVVRHRAPSRMSLGRFCLMVNLPHPWAEVELL